MLKIKIFRILIVYIFVVLLFAIPSLASAEIAGWDYDSTSDWYIFQGVNTTLLDWDARIENVSVTETNVKHRNWVTSNMWHDVDLRTLIGFDPYITGSPTVYYFDGINKIKAWDTQYMGNSRWTLRIDYETMSENETATSVAYFPWQDKSQPHFWSYLYDPFRDTTWNSASGHQNSKNDGWVDESYINGIARDVIIGD